MTINFLSNSTASVLGAVASGGAQTQLSVTANAPFELNDLVFVDWKTGAILNQNTMPPGAALTAGPAQVNFNFIDYPVTAANIASAGCQIGPDGSLYLLGSGYSGNSPYRRTIVLYKYSSRGILQAKGVVYHIGSTSSGILNNSAGFALLSNGNILVTYMDIVSSTVIQYAILSPALRTIYSGSIVAAAGAPAVGTSHIQPTSTGGAILVTTNGIEFISAIGVASRPVTHLNIVMGFQDYLKDGSATPDSYSRPVAVKSGTPGAFGYLYTSTAGNNVGCYYAVIEADGSQRGLLVTLTASANTMRFAVSVTNNNVMWVNQVSGSFGVINDSGSIVKAATPITNYGAYSYGIRLSSDAGGNFLLLTLNTSDYKWYLRYMSAAGVDLFASFVLANLNGNTPAYTPLIAKLSTGTVFILPCTQSGMIYNYALVSNAGVVLAQGVLLNFGSVGNGNQYATVTVLNDVVYGAATTSAGAGPTDVMVFTVSNTGAVVSVGDAMDSIAGRGQIGGSGGMRSFFDESGKYLYIVASAQSGDVGIVLTYDINLNLSTYTRLSTMTGGQLASSTVRVFGQGLLFAGSTYAQDVSGSVALGPIGVYFKTKPTALLGVAANAVAEGGALVVNTKGIYACSPSWKFATQNFDHSANVPPGNAGSVNSNFINLKGL